MKEEKQKAFKSQVGYGYGDTIGYTDDGMVFMVSDTKGPDGEPMQIFAEFTPQRADEIAASFISAAKGARKESKKAVN